ncbi:VCBS repeat-containing protein [Chryseolinea lacunae]|uniref:VCBS repeat-containing protein n=1 Tax=Chryseolinea lacunae TaxID=2801331 RepID=A0ABS1KPJ2_9BACT|nr:VCBS repeat-containing protein [Chryseolinea lacunae]MBL0741248.1 VCBS repeat-containing protein [Chryseolinea lacunae]
MRLLQICLLYILFSCSRHPDPLFKTLSSAETGIEFANTLVYSDTLTVLDFEYLFNGGGVGIGDVNNDGLQDLYFSANMTSGKLYLNKGDFKFEDITEKAGLITTAWVNGVTMIDINQDGFTDIFLSVAGTRHTPSPRRKNLLYINNGNNTFTESAAAYGLQGTGHNIQTAFLDYDKDGDLDVYILRNAFVEYSRNRARPKSVKGESSTTDQLYRNNGDNTFTDVSAEAGITIEGFGLGVQVCDLNDDGWPDVFVSNDFITNDLVYMNNRDGTFSNRAGAMLKHQTYNAMGNDVADINNDGLVDVVEVDMLPEDNLRWKVTIMGNTYDEFQNGLHYGYEPQYLRNTLQINNGNGTFSDIGYLAGIEATDWSWSPLLADYDNDGLKDLFITNGYRQDITNLDFIKFSERALRMGTAEGNKKERLDMLAKVPGIKVHKYIYKNNGDLTFTDQSDAWGFTEPLYSNGAVYADLDNDGDLDLVVNNIDAPASVMKNTTPHEAGAKTKANFLRVKFLGTPKNRDGWETKVYLRYKGRLQYQYFTPVRGYLSSVEPFLHFGVDSAAVVDSVEVIWPDGRYELLQDVKTNQVITLNHNASKPRDEKPEPTPNTPFAEVLPAHQAIYKHEENDYVDFKTQPLLPHMHSRNGPGIAVADVNADGFEDFFVGGASQHRGALFLQDKDGHFKKSDLPKNDTTSEDMGVLFFDADGDGDPDLYVASGGSEETKDSPHYIDHLYVNDGKGNFAPAEDVMSPYAQSGSGVIAADYDHDGDLDLFVGGRLIPREYPLPAASYIFRNDSRQGNLKFTDVTSQVAPALLKAGLVTTALWTDVDNDGWIDLLMVGEFMPVTCLRNDGGKTFAPWGTTSLANSSGWWNSLTSGDFDNDGDTDYIGGNLGLNSRYKASEKEPLRIYASDYDKTGSVDPVMTMYWDGTQQIVHSWDDMVKQMSPIRIRFRTYQPYAEATFEDSFLKSETDAAYHASAQWLSTSYIENVGKGEFKITALPVQAQFAPVYGMVTLDADGDGNEDVLLSGNSYATEVSTGRYDAFTGLLLKGDGHGNFNAQTIGQSGFVVDKDAKGMARLVAADNRDVIVSGVNNDALQLRVSRDAGKYLRASNRSAYALLKLKNGKTRRHEFYFGSTYLSQSSRTLRLTDDVVSFTLYDFSGKPEQP